MGKYKYSDEEQRMNNVLKYQDEQLQELLSDSKNQRNETDAEIEVLENKLKQLGIDVSKVKKIDRQFEYNTYIRDFFANNKGKNLDDAIKCWKYKKQLQGHNKYEKSDLVALK